MKKSLWLITLVALCILTCSCGQNQPDRPIKPSYEKITESELKVAGVETGNVGGEYVFYADNGILLKYHIPTGTAAIVCPDPFCPHQRYGSSCQFAVESRLMTSIGNVLYYTMVDQEWHQYLRSYGADSMKVEEIRATNGRLSRIFSYNYYLYFSEHLPTKVEGEFTTTVYRLDTQSGALEVIDCGHPFARMELIEAGRIVWVDDLKYYSTDLDGDDWRIYEQNYCREWGKYRLRWELGKWTYDKIYCKDLNTKEEVLIAKDVADFFVYGDKMLYVKFVENPQVWITVDGQDQKDLYGGDIYVVNLDGTDDKLLCHVEDFIYAGPSADRNNEFVCGDWVGFSSENYYDEKGYPSLTFTDMLVVNVITGEYRFIKYNPYEM
jgi:hypothetical protein